MSDTTPKKKTYRLCALPTTAETTAEVEGQRFSRITADYTLVYTAGRVPTGGIKLTEADASRLTAADRRWLDDCNAVLIAEQIAKDKPRILSKLNDLLNTIEANIEQAQTQNETEGVDADDDGQQPDSKVSA